MLFLGTLCERHGVGPVCHELDIAPSTYYSNKNHRQHPEKRSQLNLPDELLKLESQRVYDENYSVYNLRNLWRQLRREGFSVARCTITPLMKNIRLSSVLRGKKRIRGVHHRLVAGGILGGVCHHRWKPRSFWMHLSRHCGPVDRHVSFPGPIGNREVSHARRDAGGINITLCFIVNPCWLFK
ncbi:IS3 family transposase [Salmonella enterica subsp. enterica serovar Javiana]|nr:IS3 family transposase [Salmonella enterica]EDR1539064.1 IS3 family transposase [Salmonella enterica subsp. enterica serovar Javiana]EIV1873147.1 IS3 family transposase [Salmonella enterica]EKB2995412.1 IS3 family transposase [Salmonella enterica]